MGTCRKKVLVVEDDESIRVVLCQVLREEGYEVEAVTDGDECLQLLSVQRDFCVVFLDLLMPRVDGFKVIGQLEKDPERVPPIVVCTASSQAGPKQYPVLRKPMDVERILDVLKQHCS